MGTNEVFANLVDEKVENLIGKPINQFLDKDMWSPFWTNLSNLTETDKISINPDYILFN